MQTPLIYPATEGSTDFAADFASQLEAQSQSLNFMPFKDGEVEIGINDRDEAIGRSVIVAGHIEGDSDLEATLASVADVTRGLRQNFRAAQVHLVMNRISHACSDDPAIIPRSHYRTEAMLRALPTSLTVLEPINSFPRANRTMSRYNGTLMHKVFTVAQERQRGAAIALPGQEHRLAQGQIAEPPPPEHWGKPIMFGTAVSEYFSHSVANYMGIEHGTIERREDRPGRTELAVVGNTSLQNRPVFVVGGTETESAQAELEHLLMAFREMYGANILFAVQPYQGYGTAERLTKSKKYGWWTFPRGFHRQQAVFAAQPNSVTLFDLHSEATMHAGGGLGQVDLLYGQSIFLSLYADLQREFQDQLRLVAPDLGRAPWVQSDSDASGIPMVGLQKNRSGADQVEANTANVDVALLRQLLEGKVAVQRDDLFRTGGTADGQAQFCRDLGAQMAILAATHVELPGDSEQRMNSGALDRMYVTNSHSRSQTLDSAGKVKVLDVARLFADRLQKYLP